MSFGQPWALALLALAVPIAILYLLRGAPRRRPTTAAFLWRELAEQTTSRRKWRRPPRSLALLLQLLALLVGVLALARPALSQEGGRQLVYVLDASASMQASDLTPTRFEAARAQLRTELARLLPGDQVTLIRLGQQAEVLAQGTDRAALQTALEAARPGLAPVRLRDALALAARQLSQPLAAGSEIVVLSDGTLPELSGLGPLPAPVRFVKVGAHGENQGVTALEVRPAPGGTGSLGAFALLTNYGTQATRLSVRLAADGLPLEDRLVDLPPRGRAEVPFSVPAGTRSVSVRLSGQDILTLDDRAEVSVPGNRQRVASIVSRTPEPWQQALGVLPGLTIETQSPEAYRDTGAELVLFDGFLPPELPGGHLVVVNPPAGNPLIEVRGEQRDVQVSATDPASPLLRSIDLAAIRLVRVARLTAPAWAQVVAETQAGPLILQGEFDGRRVVVLGFDPMLSGLEKLVAFPLLVANLADLLGGSGVDPWLAPGTPALLPVRPEALEVTLTLPDGSSRPIKPRAGVAAIEQTDQVGRYLLRQRLPTGQSEARPFYVHLFGEAEGDVAPRDRASIAAAGPAEAGPVPFGPPIWLPLVALTLGLFGAEWLHYRRRG
jgi:hypothetical protein